MHHLSQALSTTKMTEFTVLEYDTLCLCKVHVQTTKKTICTSLYLNADSRADLQTCFSAENDAGMARFAFLHSHVGYHNIQTANNGHH